MVHLSHNRDNWLNVGSWGWLVVFGALGAGVLLYRPADSATNPPKAASANKELRTGSSSELNAATHQVSLNKPARIQPASTASDADTDRPYTTRNIEDLRMGDRVLAHNPEVSAAERARWHEPDWSVWWKLSLVMPKPDGSELKIEMLRPESWVIQQLGFVIDAAQANYVLAPDNNRLASADSVTPSANSGMTLANHDLAPADSGLT